MSKITKKQLHNGWYCHDTEIIKMKKELRELKQSVLRLERLTDEKLLDEPQLKQLDQSIFDGLDEGWRFAAVDGNKGFPIVYEFEPYAFESGKYYSNHHGLYKDLTHLTGYDASNWQNSLIERDIAKELLEVDLSSELTGSELCRAMLARGDEYVMCLVSDSSEHVAIQNEILGIVTGTNSKDLFTTSSINAWIYVVPINNQGEPLTASEAGL